MTLRLLLSLAIAAAVAVPGSLSSGSSAVAVTPDTSATVDIAAGLDALVAAPAATPAAPAAPEADTAWGEVGATVEDAALVVVPAAEAAPAEPKTRRAPGADEPTPDATGDTVPAEVGPEDLPAVDPAADAVVAALVDAVQPDRVVTPPVATTDAQTVGVTWPAGTEAADLAPQARYLDGSTWSDWVDLEASDAVPDPGTADEGSEVRGGTDSLWIGDAQAVQLSFAATPDGGPQDMSLALVGSPELAPAAEPTTEGAASAQDAQFRTAAYVSDTTAVVPAAVAAPRVYSRGEWGARGQVCAPDVASTLLAAVVHHTAGSNNYSTVAQAMQQIRNDQAYHITGRGWCDIGYNFLVDKWGNVYEGRANSGTRPVIGVHAGGFNTATVGVSMLGDYSTVTPSVGTQEAVARVIAWRLAPYFRDPSSTVGYRTLGGENSRYPAGTTLALPVVVGHRDTAYTACPGNAGYATLGAIKARSRTLIGAGFINPATTATSLGIGGSTSISGGVITGANWTLSVTDTRTNAVVRKVTGTSGASGGGTIASWNGKADAGNDVGPGSYRLTLSGTYGATILVPYAVNVTVSGSQNPPTVAPVALTGDLGFVPMSPTRVLDTRPTGAALGPASRADVKVAGVSGIPADAKAVALTVTAVHSSTITYVSAWPAGQTRPNASIVNSAAGRAVAGSVVLGVGGEGKVSLFNNSGSTHLLVDVTGYYTTSATAGFTGLTTATRVLDTRSHGGSPVAASTRRSVQVAGVGGVPADAAAVAVNVVSVNPSGPGYVSLVPHGSPVGTTSSVNNDPGRDTANRAVVVLADGKLDVAAGGTGQHVVVDVVGWYGASASAMFHPMVPVRAFDTRSAGGPLVAGETRSLPVTAPAGVPSTAEVVALNLTATQPTAVATYVSVWGAGGRPSTSDLNTGGGRDHANQVYVAPSEGKVNVYNNLGSTHVVADVFGYFD